VSPWLVALLLSLASLSLVYLVAYAYWVYRAYRVFSLYLDSPAIREELPPFPISPLRPSFPMRLVQRVIELEMFYDFVYETGLDLSSVRRDYFRSLRTGVPVEVVSLYDQVEGP